MLPIRVVSAALLGTALCAAPAVPAAAAAPAATGHGTAPAAGAAGDRGALMTPDCRTTAHASSVVPAVRDEGRGRTAVDHDATRSDSPRGAFRCGHETRAAGLHGSASPARPGSVPALLSTPPGTVPGPVHAGLGGSVAGVSTAQLATGTALVVASLTATVYVVRRRARDR